MIVATLWRGDIPEVRLHDDGSVTIIGRDVALDADQRRELLEFLSDKHLAKATQQAMKSKDLCRGCHNDFYNHNREGGCWSFESARVVVRTSVGIWQNPPYVWLPQNTLSCHQPEGQCWIKDDDPRMEGTH